MERTITITGLHAPTRIGRTGDEREFAQTLLIDIRYAYERRDPEESTVCYDAVARAALEHCAAHRYITIEAAAAGLVRALRDAFPLTRAQVRVRKPAALKRAACVSAEACL